MGSLHVARVFQETMHPENTTTHKYIYIHIHVYVHIIYIYIWDIVRECVYTICIPVGFGEIMRIYHMHTCGLSHSSINERTEDSQSSTNCISMDYRKCVR